MEVTIPQVTINVPGPLEVLRSWRWTLLAALVLAFTLAGGASPAAAAESITSPDTVGTVGQYTSLALDASGNPVVSYLRGGSLPVNDGDLKVLHCNDLHCAGGGESIVSADNGGPANVGQYSSLALDASGNPVVSYFDDTINELIVLHCNNANCAGVGTITYPDPAASDKGEYTSLALDAAGNPVVSYHDSTNFDLKVLHCNDAICDGAGESITSPDTTGGLYTSLALDASGNPVVSYWNGGDLKVLHCNDANCAGVETPTSPDTAGDVGLYTSLALDAAGNPVVSYWDLTNNDLKVLHCDDANCAGVETPTSLDTVGNVGSNTSLALDASGFPVVSYYNQTNGDLKVLHCNDANCAGVETPTTPDTGGTANVGLSTSLALDAAGNPVVSYYDGTNGDLKLLHCNDANCAAGSTKVLPLNITNLSQKALPKTCFEVRNASQVPLFEVCDNDFAGAPALHAICQPDGVCNDDDPVAGSVRVLLTAGDYRVVESQAAPEHTAVTPKQVCTNLAPLVGEECRLTFLNTPNTDPWYPWDVNGDGVVDLFNDIFDVAFRFGCAKGATGEVCP